MYTLRNKRKVSLKQYKRNAKKMLEDFCIHLDENQIAYLYNLENEIQVDNYTKSMINKML